MPEVVSQVEALEAAGGNGAHKKRKGGKARNSNGAEPAPAPALKSWAVSSQLFPCQLSKRATELMQEVTLEVHSFGVLCILSGVWPTCFLCQARC